MVSVNPGALATPVHNIGGSTRVTVNLSGGWRLTRIVIVAPRANGPSILAITMTSPGHSAGFVHTAHTSSALAEEWDDPPNGPFASPIGHAERHVLERSSHPQTSDGLAVWCGLRRTNDVAFRRIGGLRRRGGFDGGKRRVDDRDEIAIVCLCPGFQRGRKNGDGDRGMHDDIQTLLGMAAASREGPGEQVASVIHGDHLSGSQFGCSHH